MAKILHSGDLHLDSAFGGLSSDEARVRREGLRRVFSRIVDLANDERCDALVLSGDLFDAYPIFPETAESFMRDLSRAEMPVFITPGNHDPYTADSPYKTLSFPENVHIFSAETFSFVEIPEKKLRFFGSAYLGEACDEGRLSGFSVPDDDFINIILLHGNLSSSGYCPVTPSEIESCGADYIALSHIHKPTELLKSGKTFYAYCGCPEARAFDEPYDTGVIIADVQKGYVKISRKSVSDYRYREISVDISEYPDVLSALPSPTAHEHLRLTLIGEGDSPDVSSLSKTLSERYLSAAIYDKSIPTRNLWDGEDGEGLRGIFLRKMRARINAAETEEEKQKLLRAVRLGIDAIENRDI